jgi:hypothetical protein
MYTAKEFGEEITKAHTTCGAFRLPVPTGFLIDTLAIRNAPNSLKTKESNPF